MKIVIDIPEEIYNSIQDNDYCGILNSDMYNAVKNGTTLPKGHGDLISRQAVIDLLNRLIEVERKQGTDVMNYGRERVNAYESVLWEIESDYLFPSMPSAEKTDGDLISRTDLLNKIWQKEYGKDYDGVNMLDIPHIDIIEQMQSAEKTARWIPVSKRLPEKLTDVLVTFYDCPGEYDVAYLRTTFNEIYKKNGAKNEWVSSMGETTYADYEVDAWMPIEPYKESEEKNNGKIS